MIDFITPVPLEDAVRSLGAKTPIGSAMRSAEWEMWPAEIKEMALFVSTLEDERLLAEIQRRILQRVKLQRDQLANGGEGVTMDRSRFIAEMQEELRLAGYRPDPVNKGTLQDLGSHGRLGLIWDMQLAQARGVAQWKMGQDADILRAFPCQELIRVNARNERRDWPMIWAKAGGNFYGEPSADYPDAPGRMIARKDDPIWTKISRFDTPWPPFDWGSGMGLRDVRRREAIELGVIKREDKVLPQSKPFATGTKASLRGIPESRRQVIADRLAGDVEIVGDEIRLITPERYDAMGNGKGGKIPPRPFDGRDQTPPTPDPKPLTETVTVPRGLTKAAAREHAREAIALADSVHGDGVLPPLKVELVGSLLNPALAGSYTPGIERGMRLTVNPAAVDVRWSTLHELGHFLDNHGLHTPSAERLYASWGQPEMKALLATIEHTAAFQRLAQRVRAEGTGDYWLRPQELFARAYAQFIQVETGDAGLTATVLRIRRGELEDTGLWRESQWNQVDFAPVRRAMAKLFKALGWRVDQ